MVGEKMGGGGGEKIRSLEVPIGTSKDDKRFSGDTTVNGIKIQVRWTLEEEYDIYFPQIKMGDLHEIEGVSDQVLRLDDNPDTAKKVFDEACRLAQTESNVYELYKKIDSFIRTLLD
jgi:type III secretory pathway component EscV